MTPPTRLDALNPEPSAFFNTLELPLAIRYLGSRSPR